MPERLQKILSARGIASRRKAEEYILAGLVKVNGVAATLGQKADPEVDRIEVDGKVLSDRAEMLYYVMHKPVGVETSNVERASKASSEPRKKLSRQQRDISNVPTVRDLLPAKLQGKIFPVGRLDKDSSGLLLLTNDGVLAYRLTHPKFDHEKEYEVSVDPPLPEGALQKIEKGLMIDGSKTKPAVITRMSPATFRITLTEGRYRQIRRMVQKVGSNVHTLTRVRIMTFSDPAMKTGDIRALKPSECAALLRSVDL